MNFSVCTYDCKPTSEFGNVYKFVKQYKNMTWLKINNTLMIPQMQFIIIL